jgi:hypothetical protein
MPSGATMQSRCQKVAAYVDQYQSSVNKFWVVIAQHEPWADENNPPVFHASLQEVPQPICFIYVHEVNAVFENTSGPIILPNTAFQPVTDLSIKALAAAKANNVHFEASISTEDLETLATSYRVVGLCTEVEFIDGFTPDLEIGFFTSPLNVKSYFLDWVMTSRSVSVPDQDNHTFRIIRTF